MRMQLFQKWFLFYDENSFFDWPSHEAEILVDVWSCYWQSDRLADHEVFGVAQEYILIKLIIIALLKLGKISNDLNQFLLETIFSDDVVDFYTDT